MLTSPAAETSVFSPAGVMEFRAVPGRTPAPHSVDGPLLGNGDMKVALGGKPESQRFFLGKNDLWRLQHGYGNSVPVGLGELDLEIPELAGASYLVRQPLDRPRTEAEFAKDGLVVRQTAMVATDRNLLWIRLECEGKAVEVRPTLKILAGRGSENRATFQNGILFGQRRFGKDQVDIPSGVAMAAKVLRAEMTIADAASAPTTTATYPVEIGREQLGGGRWHFDGCIDELAVYDTALKETEIQAVIVGDAIHEGSGQDKNPILSLGLVRNAVDLALDLITSEQGRPCTVINPWPGRKVLLTGNDRNEELSGERLTFKTRRNETLTLEMTE